MSDSLFGSLMGELSRYLHFMSGFFESPLIGYKTLSCSQSKGVCPSIGGRIGVIHPKTYLGPGHGYHRR